MKFLFLGGDSRIAVAINELSAKGYTVESLGVFDGDSGDISSADVLILPVPTTRDNKNIFCPLTNRQISLAEIRHAKPRALILSCGYMFEGMNCIDYLTLDSFCLLNAVPTAEGAIARAIQDTDFCIWKSRVLVIGNGRVGKILAQRLKGLVCDLTVAARKERDFAFLDALGMKFIHTDTVAATADNYDIIFNTVDTEIFKQDFYKLKNCFLYDLSTKGCIDFEGAAVSGIKAVKLPGIPGKTAPLTAGKIIAQTVIDLTRQGVDSWNI